MAEPVDGLAFLLWACDPDQPARLATPFYQAAAAAAMEWPVEMYFTARSVHLLMPGVAASLRPSAHHPATVWDAMRAAIDQGVSLYACTDALQAQGLAGKPLIPACSGHGGAVQFMLRAGDRRWRTLVF